MHLVDYIVVICLFTIKLVHGKKNRFVQIFSSTEDVLSSYFDTILRVDDNYSRVCYVKGCYSASYKVVCSWTVYNIELFT